jgi:imidazolonepropionase-like amidohydrolase
MSNNALLSLAATLLALVPSLAVAQDLNGPPLVITHVTVIDPESESVRPDMTVIVRDGRIASIDPSTEQESWPGANVVEGTGKYLIPGLWDMHVHLSLTTRSALPVLVANGITTVRDLGGNLSEIDGWRGQIDAGYLTGPRILRVGPMLNGQSFNHLQMVPGDSSAIRGAARVLKQIGVDAIKIHRRLPRESYFALLDEAKQLGIPVVGHIPMTVTPSEASDAGQATIEHAETLFEGTFTTEAGDVPLSDAIRRFRSEGAEELFARFVRNGTPVTPTLVAYRSIIESAEPPATPDPRRRYVAASMLRYESEQESAVSADELAEVRAVFAELREVVRQMHAAGVTLLTGTDTAITRLPGFSLHDELGLLVGAGLSPMEALHAATIAPATAAGRSEELGSIAVGKIGDLVVLAANPLEDISNTQRIDAVVLNGVLLDRPRLDELLAEGERLALAN